jgi:hypothetical protein
MSIEVMRQALEALNKNVGELRIAGARHILRTAIAEAEKQEQCKEHGECFGGKCIYTAPPAARRDWVGLTDEQINQYDYQYRDILYDVEKMLRDNNT